MMMSNLVAGAAAILAGMLILGGVSRRWKWFLNSFRVQAVFRVLGNSGALAFYIALGVLLMAVGILMLVGIDPVMVIFETLFLRRE